MSNTDPKTIQNLLHQSVGEEIDLASLLGNKENSTRKKDEQGRLDTDISVTFDTKQVAALVDGRAASEGDVYIPSFHNLDVTLNTVVIPSYINGCPIARFYLWSLENQSAELTNMVDISFKQLSHEIRDFMAKNPSYIINSPKNSNPLKRNLSFSSPHVRELIMSAVELEKVIKLQATLIKIKPRERARIMREQQVLFKLFRRILHSRSHYTTNGATALDFKQGNIKSIEQIKNNSKELPLPDGFAESDACSVFFENYKTAEDIEKENNRRHDAAMSKATTEELEGNHNLTEDLSSSSEEILASNDSVTNT